LLIIYFIVSIVYGREVYQDYHYMDKHKVKTVLNNKVINENAIINANLHVRTIDINNTIYTIFWLENGVKDKNMINKESVYAPFIVKGKQKDEFQVEKLMSLSKDTYIQKRLLGIIQSLQYKKREGDFLFINSLGKVKVKQTKINDTYVLHRLKQYSQNQAQEDIKYIYSDTNISIDPNSNLWQEVLSKDKIKIKVKLFDATIIDTRYFHMKPIQNSLPKEHWFFKLSYDISKWNFSKKQISLTYDEALENFDKYNNEMKSLLDDRDGFILWLHNHIEFLQYLDEMLHDKSLDDKVSRILFANLGALNTAESSNILANIVLDTTLEERDRFRSLMGLKNTSAPLDDDVLDSLISYGLSPATRNDIMKKATGMLLGTLARERIDRVPEQYEKLSNAIKNAIEDSDNKVVALSAAGNMLSTAPDSIVETVENVMMSDNNALNRRNGAEAIRKIGRTKIDTKKFQDLIQHESNTYTAQALILSSTYAKDFKDNKNFQGYLANIAQNKIEQSSNRVAALKALEKADFTNDESQRRLIRKMMIGEKNVEVIKMLKKLYRKSYN